MNLVVQEKMDIASSNSREKETQTCRIYMEEGVCEQVIYILVAREGFVMFMLHSSYSQNLPFILPMGKFVCGLFHILYYKEDCVRGESEDDQEL